jgi:hypothetical protein
MFRKFLYSRMRPAVIFILLLFAAAAPRSSAQGRPELKRPEEIPEKPPEIKKKPAKGSEPRAVGLLQLNSSGKATLIPIVIRIDGRFYDASVYKADPVPMALESGTVYEAEQAGDSQGLFTVNGALHSKNPGSANLWVGTGSYLPRGAEAASTTHKAENVPVGLDNSDEPPRLTRGDSSKAATTPTSTAPTTASTSTSAPRSGTATPTSQSSPPSTPSASTPTGTSSGQETNKSSSPATPDRSADAKGQMSGGTQKGSDQTTQPASSSPSAASEGSKAPAPENYYRPALRRGKPTETAPEEPETTPKAVKAETAGKTNAVSGEPVQLVPAISDAAGPDPKSYKFFWKTGEEQERRDQMLALAGDQVRAYARALVRNQIPAKPLATRAPVAGRKSAEKQEQPVFEKLQFQTYDVWVNNQPVMVLTAEAHFVPAPGAAAGTADQTFSIALVAKTDIYGNLHKLYSGVTDKFHLDVTPRLELIDVVDIDGDGRGELLFRETTDAGSGYVIYRATADKLWKMFDNLNAE